MYSIYADDICIYNDAFSLDHMKVIKPKLVMEDSAAGSTLTIPSSNVGYDYIQELTTDISVRKYNVKNQEDVEIWAGRVISEDIDFWNNRTLYCEGELAFLNDTTQPPKEYHGLSVYEFLEILLKNHNEGVALSQTHTMDDSRGNSIQDNKGKDIPTHIMLPTNRQFRIGAVDVHDSNDSLYRYTNYEKTIECINEKLINKLGGHIRVRKENDIRYLDYLADYPNINRQTIKFGKNLVDFTRNWDQTEFATVIVPLGKRLEDEEKPEGYPEALDAYVTLEGYTGSSHDGSIYVRSDAAIREYGWIEKVIHWDDVTQPQNLLSKAREYLRNTQFDSMTIELSALDLHYMNVDYEAVKLLDKIMVVSEPHGMSGRYFPVKKLEIPLDSPENTVFTLGDNIKTSLTSVNNKTNSKLLDKIDNIPKLSTSSILDKARANADQMINMATNGYITIERKEDAAGYHTETLYISNAAELKNATRYWKWNVNGLAYYTKNTDDKWYNDVKRYGPKLALTMDGTISADFITVGTLNADIIKAGTISDKKGKNYWNLKTGEFKLTASATSVSTKKGDSSLSEYVTDKAETAVTNYDKTLNQTAVFNKLTKNGTLQGIYMSKGVLYINASFIKAGTLKSDYVLSGTITVGGAGNGNGKISVQKSDGTEVCSFSRDGAIINGTLYNEYSKGFIQVNESKIQGGRFDKDNKKQQYGYISLREECNFYTWTETEEKGYNTIEYKNQKTMRLHSSDVIAITAKHLLVSASGNDAEIDKMFTNGEMYVAQTTKKIHPTRLKFINGLLVEWEGY